MQLCWSLLLVLYSFRITWNHDNNIIKLWFILIYRDKNIIETNTFMLEVDFYVLGESFLFEYRDLNE